MCGILCLISKNNIELNYFLNLLERLQHRDQYSYGYSYINNKIIVKNIFLMMELKIEI